MELQPYFGDLHIHSRRSDGSLKPEEIFQEAGKAYLDFVALADHDLRPYQLEFSTVLSIPATEFSLGHHWHMVAIGENLPGTPDKADEVPDWSHELHVRGGILILAHPWTVSQRPSALEAVERWLSQGVIDGIELLNTSVEPSQRDAWLEMFRLYRTVWANYQPAIIGGSDYHHFRHGRQIGLGCTYIFAENLTVTSIIRAIKMRQTVASVPQGGELWAEWFQWLNLFVPHGELGVGPPHMLSRLAKFKRLAENCHSIEAVQALYAGNYRYAVYIEEKGRQ
ncbi:MAG TPA: CehA/McbA family metallohydrolase [Bacillota bacterium]|nr:CehA/McbA family metallohydrolase [Bacillota bacterium]